jgi:hypothetical protein
MNIEEHTTIAVDVFLAHTIIKSFLVLDGIESLFNDTNKNKSMYSFNQLFNVMRA